MKTKFCTKSKKDSCRRAPAAPPAISKAGFTRSTRGSATALLLHLTTTCIILKYFHWPLRNSISLKKKTQNLGKTVLFCSRYQGLSTVLWAPSHLSLNQLFPLLIFHVTQGCQIQLSHEVYILESSILLPLSKIFGNYDTHRISDLWPV